MLLVTTPSGSDLSPAALATAEAMVAAELGVTTLAERNVAESGTVGSSGLISLRTGPCTAISSLTLNGAPAAGVLESPWTVNVGNVAGLYGGLNPWPPGGGVRYTVSYTAGWTAETLPEQVRQAILMTAQAIESRPDPTLKSESEGPVSRSWDTSLGLPPQAGVLLAPWQQVRF